MNTVLTVTSIDWLQELNRIWGKRLKLDEPLTQYTSFRIGGPAQALLVVQSTDELCEAVRWAQRHDIAYYVIGQGSNVLISDNGLLGFVVANRCRSYRLLELVDSATLFADSGVRLSKLAHQVAIAGWSGLEWAVGMPGTLGGAIVGNAGAFGRDISDSLVNVKVLEGDGQKRTLLVSDLNFTYRSSRFKKEMGSAGRRTVVLSVELALNKGEPDEILKVSQKVVQSRRAAQPLGQPSAGSIFKNPPNEYAGRLIEKAGLKGLRVGDAQVSMQHANFIVNVGNATASDVLKLIELIRNKVSQSFSQELDLEIEYIR